MILMMVVASNKIIFYENTILKTEFEGVWKISIWSCYILLASLLHSKAFLLHILSFVICIVPHTYTI